MLWPGLDTLPTAWRDAIIRATQADLTSFRSTLRELAASDAPPPARDEAAEERAAGIAAFSSWLNARGYAPSTCALYAQRAFSEPRSVHALAAKHLHAIFLSDQDGSGRRVAQAIETLREGWGLTYFHLASLRWVDVLEPDEDPAGPTARRFRHRIQYAGQPGVEFPRRIDTTAIGAFDVLAERAGSSSWVVPRMPNSDEPCTALAVRRLLRGLA